MNAHMKSERLKRLFGGFVAMAVVGLVGAPSAPVTAAMDDSTGLACAMYGIDEHEPQDSDGDGYPDDSDTCPYDASNQCAGCSAAEHSANVATGMSITYGAAGALGGLFNPFAGVALFGVALFHQAGALYIQHYQNPECF